MKLDDIKDPNLRRRIEDALHNVELLEHELKTHCPIPSPEPESVVRHEPLAAGEGKGEGACGIIVRIRSFRSRLLDPDNLCAKSLVDGLRYAGLIPGDRPQDIELTVTQEKCDKQDERTEIEMIY